MSREHIEGVTVEHGNTRTIKMITESHGKDTKHTKSEQCKKVNQFINSSQQKK
jgi:hypothetical protein